MKKARILSLFTTLILTCSLLFNITAFAAVAAPYSSPTLHSYSVRIHPGDRAGEIRIGYDVTANTIADSLGVSSITIYNANNLPVKMVSGSEVNGMIKKDSVYHQSVYLYSGTSGATYYAAVTVFATIGEKSDSRTITTTRATAPTSSTP